MSEASKPTKERLHVAGFWTYQRPCEEALANLSEAYNRLADQWEAMHAALTEIDYGIEVDWALGVDENCERLREVARKALSGL